MTTFYSTTRTHAQSAQVDREVAAFTADGDIISDASAVAIAGYWASPAVPDLPFTLLAQRGEGDTAELGAAIKRELDFAEVHGNDAGGMRDGDCYLAALDAWVAAHEEP